MGLESSTVSKGMSLSELNAKAKRLASLKASVRFIDELANQEEVEDDFITFNIQGKRITVKYELFQETLKKYDEDLALQINLLQAEFTKAGVDPQDGLEDA